LSAINQTEFESLRTALMNGYNSQTTNHVAVVIALTVGMFVLISSKDFRDLYDNHSARANATQKWVATLK